MFSTPENGWIETKIKLKAVSGAEISCVESSCFAKLLSHITYGVRLTEIANISAPETAFNLLFVSIPPFSWAKNTML